MLEEVVPNINPARVFWPSDAMHRTKDLTFETVCSYLIRGRIVIANVNQGHHFVLLTGWLDDGDSMTVNDPATPGRETYSYDNDIVGFRIFDMVRA